VPAPNRAGSRAPGSQAENSQEKDDGENHLIRFGSRRGRYRRGVGNNGFASSRQEKGQGASPQKYRDYRPLGEITETEQYEIVAFESELWGAAPFYDSNGDIFFSTERQKPESDNRYRIYHKINRHGAVADTISEFSVSRPVFSAKTQGEVLTSQFEEYDGDITQLKSDHFHPLAFVREKWHRRESAWSTFTIGGAPTTREPNRWSGTVFIDIVLRGDTLKIKKPMDMIARNPGVSSWGASRRGFSSPDLELYFDEDTDFFIIVEGSRIYLIRPKQ
jgi:hypothetical protein